MRPYLIRILMVTILGPMVCMGLYLFAQNPALFSDISASIQSVAGWKRLYVNSPFSANLLTINNGCAPNRLLYAVFGASTVPSASHPPGLYSSGDSGKTWALVSDLQSYSLSNADPQILCGGSEIILIRLEKAVLRIDPANRHLDDVPLIGPSSQEVLTYIERDPWENRIVYAAGNASGLWLSLDYGLTWRKLQPPVKDATITSISLDYHRPANLFVATTAGLYKSPVRGLIWERTGQGLPTTTNRKILEIEWDPVIPDQGYLAIGYGPFNEPLFAKSTDNGASWIFSGDGPQANASITALIADRGSVFATTSLSYNSYPATPASLYRSPDGGTQWEQIAVPDLGGSDNVISLRIDPTTHDLYLRTTGGLLLSKDNGLSWSVLIRTISPTITSIAANHRYYAGSNQGIFFSEDGGVSWTSRNNGLYSESTALVQVHPSRPELVFAGTADGKLFRTEDSGLNWRLVWDGTDPVQVLLISEQSPDVLYATTSAGDLLLSEDMGAKWRTIEHPPTGKITDGALSADSLLVVLNGSELWQSPDRGKTWSQMVIGYPHSQINDIAAKPGAFFAILDGSTLIRSSDGTSWQRTAVQPVQSGMQAIISRYDDSPILYLKTSNGIFLSESNGDAWQLVLGDTSNSIHLATLDYAEGVVLAVTGSNILAGEPETIKGVQRENLRNLFFGSAAAADRVIVISQYFREPLVTTLFILGFLFLCLLFLVLNLRFFLAFLWNTLEILFLPGRAIQRVNMSRFVEDRSYPFFFVVWSCAISFGVFAFSFGLSIPIRVDRLADTSIFQFFTLGLFESFSTIPFAWQWAFFLTTLLLFVLLLLYAGFQSVVLRFLFRAEENLGWMFTASFSFTCLVVSALINLLILLSLTFNFAGFHSLFWGISAIWFGILNIRFIRQLTSLPVYDSSIAFAGTLLLPLVGAMALARLLYRYLRKWPWQEALRLLIAPILNPRTSIVHASQLVENTGHATSFLLVYLISLAPLFVFVYLNGGSSVSSPLYSLWHDAWTVWLFPPSFATVVEIYAQWLNANDFPTRHKNPALLFGWVRNLIALVLFFVSLNFWARCLGLLMLIFDEPTTRWSVGVIYSLTVIARFAAMVFVAGQVYPNLLRTARSQIARRLKELISLPQTRAQWDFVRLTFRNPSAILTYVDERPGGAKLMNVFLLSAILIVVSILVDLVRAQLAQPSVADFLILPHRLFAILILFCLAFVTALIFSYWFLAAVLKENRRPSIFKPEGNFQVFPGYVQVVELILFFFGLFTILTSFIAILTPPGVGRFFLMFLLWAGFFLYSLFIFAGIGNLKLEELPFSRMLFRSILQSIIAGIWGVLLWISRSIRPETSNSISIILEWQDLLLTKARADVYLSRIGKYEKAKVLYRSILEKSKTLKRLDFRDWQLPQEVMQRYGLAFAFLPEPEVKTNALPLKALITSTLVNLSTLEITEALNYINESMDDNAPESWERLPECREGAVHALAQILMQNKELVVQNIASLVPRNIPSQVIFEISDLLPDKGLSSLYLAFGRLVSYAA